jgi:putative FmdB family regulatory protein
VPLYEYACRKCKKRTERIEKFVGRHLRKCPFCGGPVERLVSAPAIQFKGSGWYVTDYGRAGSADTKNAQESKTSSDKAETSTETKGESKTEAKAPASKERKKGSSKDK